MKRTWKTWHLLVVAVVALLVGGGLGTSGAEDNSDKLKQAEAAAADADQRADEAEDQAEKDIAAANQRAEAEALQELNDRTSRLEERSAELDAREADIASRQATLDAQTSALQAAQFGDGLHQVGRDIEAGSYHTEGRADCYWAMLGADGRDIIDNNISDGPQTIIIDSPFFSSKGCGTWTKVG